MTSGAADLVKKYIEICSPDEKARLSILYNGSIKTAKNYNEDATASRLRDWEAAKKALAEELEDLHLRYDVSAAAPALTEAPAAFKSRKQVFDWLHAQGRWQVSQRTVYNHAKEGRLRPGTDGVYTLAAVKRYARNHLVEVASGLKAGDNLEALQETKLRKEILHRDEQIDKLKRQRELDEGKFFPTADLEMEVAARAAVLVTGLYYLISTRVGEWITLVDGDRSRREALVETIWEQFTDRLNEYATTAEYQVVVRDGEKSI